MTFRNALDAAAQLILNKNKITAFTGAGISVESGIPPFRGTGGLWNRYDPAILDLDTYLKYPNSSWPVIKEIFYDYFGKAKPNPAHYALAEFENVGLDTVITQNIDNLHQKAGSKHVVEFHGTSHSFICTSCHEKFLETQLILTEIPPACPHCTSLLKPDFIFFGEAIPETAYLKSLEATQHSDLFLVIGTTGEINPASQIPRLAHKNGIPVIEINPENTVYSNTIAQVHIREKAGIALPMLLNIIRQRKTGKFTDVS